MIKTIVYLGSLALSIFMLVKFASRWEESVLWMLLLAIPTAIVGWTGFGLLVLIGSTFEKHDEESSKRTVMSSPKSSLLSHVLNSYRKLGNSGVAIILIMFILSGGAVAIDEKAGFLPVLIGILLGFLLILFIVIFDGIRSFLLYKKTAGSRKK